MFFFMCFIESNAVFFWALPLICLREGQIFGRFRLLEAFRGDYPDLHSCNEKTFWNHKPIGSALGSPARQTSSARGCFLDEKAGSVLELFGAALFR